MLGKGCINSPSASTLLPFPYFCYNSLEKAQILHSLSYWTTYVTGPRNTAISRIFGPHLDRETQQKTRTNSQRILLK